MYAYHGTLHATWHNRGPPSSPSFTREGKEVEGGIEGKSCRRDSSGGGGGREMGGRGAK